MIEIGAALFPTFPPAIFATPSRGIVGNWHWTVSDDGYSYMPTIVGEHHQELLLLFFGIGNDWGDEITISAIQPEDEDPYEEIDRVSFAELECEDGVRWTRPRLLGAIVSLGARHQGMEAGELADLLAAADEVYAALYERGAVQ